MMATTLADLENLEEQLAEAIHRGWPQTAANLRRDLADLAPLRKALLARAKRETTRKDGRLP
jgi:hypothetical protein